MDIDKSISEVLSWGQQKLDSKQEPPWATPIYEQLVDALTSIQAGRASTVSIDDANNAESDLSELDMARLKKGKAKIIMPM